MESSSSDDLGRQGQSGNQSLQEQLSQEGQRAFGGESAPTQSYFEPTGAAATGGDGTAGHIPTIPEGSAVRATDVPKCPPSPQTSSAPTTETTTTPTSIENVSSSCEGHAKDPIPAFPTSESFSPPRKSVPADPSWGGVVPSMPMYGDSHQPTEAGYDSYQEQTQSSPQQQQQQQPRYNPAHYPAALKMLVSNNVAGSIIGRAGQTISELQSQSMTRIKLSQTGDYYPGTQDRVCLVQGEPANVKAALRLLLDRLYMLQEHQHSQHMAWQLQMQKGGSSPGFDFVVRLLVPNSCCGMIIGKSGSNIKFMEETTGVSSVRLSPKDTPDVGFSAIMAATSERIVTITGPTLDCCVQCLYLVVDGMTSHPDICRYTNMTTSYSRVLPDTYVASATAASRPVLVSVPPPRHSSPEQHIWESIQASSGYGPGIHPQRRISSSPDLAGLVLTGIPTEPPQTPERLAGYGTSGLSGGPFPSSIQLPGTPTPGPVPPPYAVPLQGQDAPGNAGGDASSSGFHHSLSAPDLLSYHLEQAMHLSTPPQLRPPPTMALHPHPIHSTSQPPIPHPIQPGLSMDYSEGFVPQVPTLTGPGCFSVQVLVPETMIGSILGRGGRALTELQMLSGTRIRISQRGEYMPGTRSRIVTIRGPTSQTVWQAQYMMSQRMVLPPTAAPAAAVSGGGGSPHPSSPRTPSLKQHTPPALQASSSSSSSQPPPSPAGASKPSKLSPTPKGVEAYPVPESSTPTRPSAPQAATPSSTAKATSESAP